MGPGAGEAVDQVSATPTFSWQAYSSADTYDVIVFDTFGNVVWERNALPKTDTSVAYAGPTLAPGGLYQWRVTARRNANDNPRGNPISRSEELEGLFRVQP